MSVTLILPLDGRRGVPWGTQRTPSAHIFVDRRHQQKCMDATESCLLSDEAPMLFYFYMRAVPQSPMKFVDPCAHTVKGENAGHMLGGVYGAFIT